MTKLIVEVLNARDLLPTDDHGSASPFVEVDFNGSRQRTQTRTRDLYPTWNEKLVFNIQNPPKLHDSIVKIILYNDRFANHIHKDFLGCVHISGTSVSLLESEAAVQRYPLSTQRFFSHCRGDIALRIYTVRAHYDRNQQTHHRLKSTMPKLKEISDHKEKYKRSDKKKHFQSNGTGSSVVAASKVKIRSYSNNTGTHGLMMPLPVSHSLVQPRQSLIDQMGSPVGEDQKQFLFVKVVEARDFPFIRDLGPYVEVKFRDYKGITRNIVKNESLVWDEVFCFRNEGPEWNLVEVVVKEFATDKFVGSIVVSDPVPIRAQADGSLTPRWYDMENQEGKQVRGQIKLAFWMGTDAHDAFPEAKYLDSHQNTCSGIYFSPNLYYLRVHVTESQNLEPLYKNIPPEFQIVFLLGLHAKWSRNSTLFDGNPVWDEEVMMVASEPLNDFLIIDVYHILARYEKEWVGRTVVPMEGIQQRFDTTEHIQPQWFSLNGMSSNEGGNKKKQGKIRIKLCLEASYHVKDCCHSAFQPSAKHLREDSIGRLEVTILGASKEMVELLQIHIV